MGLGVVFLRDDNHDGDAVRPKCGRPDSNSPLAEWTIFSEGRWENSALCCSPAHGVHILPAATWPDLAPCVFAGAGIGTEQPLLHEILGATAAQTVCVS